MEGAKMEKDKKTEKTHARTRATIERETWQRPNREKLATCLVTI